MKKIDQPKTDKSREEFRIFVERFIHFKNLWIIYRDFRSKHYEPSLPSPGDESSATDIGATLMFQLYAFFYSLIEDSEDSVNGFRVWRQRFPEEETAIAAVEAQVSPFAGSLRIFRNRLGFHGSRSRAHESSAFDLFTRHSGTVIWGAMRNFQSLGVALLAKANAQQGLPNYHEDVVRGWIDSVASRAAMPQF